MKESLAERLEGFALSIEGMTGFARRKILETIGGCTLRNVGEIAAALREREARFASDIPGPSPEQEIKHLAEQCETLLAENRSLRAFADFAKRWCDHDKMSAAEVVSFIKNHPVVSGANDAKA